MNNINTKSVDLEFQVDPLFHKVMLSPVIYSNLKAISKRIDPKNYIHLVNPNDSYKIGNIILSYLTNKKQYYDDCQSAFDIAQNEFNWSVEEKKLIHFINNI